VKAAVELHSTVGPSRTTFTEVARRAGVSRPTLYRHFPTMPALFAACSASGMAADPMPDPRRWAQAGGPEAHLRAGLLDLYGYYRRNQVLQLHLRRDSAVAAILEQVDPDYLKGRGPAPEPRVLALLGQMSPMIRQFERDVINVLSSTWKAAERGSDSLESALAVICSFDTWRTLALGRGLDDEAAADIGVAMARGASTATGSSRRRRSRRG
jgi:AcrR family transcriptional regulator